ncbi:hypothetical protein NP603_11655 [Methylomonas sp. SURF-1]|uniref:Uncharacterized protein n=1 Tax=Methylomonas aurea TaxID=2952224 RepID=A0ABT1UI11_9GAMM|nr:hypothetical protein [Methylomonas sp. SURF-1]MCQ8181767.1 hypothetical protein [Methylomonas sp. SURF-1]
MNAAEHIVEAYFRLCRKCFTLTDLKVIQGNNRQFDLLAINIHENLAFHVEVGVTHRPNWAPTVVQLESGFEKKFFGSVPKRESKANGKTDHEKGKIYFDQIQNTYQAVGIDPEKVQRVWVCWIVKGKENTQPITLDINSKTLNRRFKVEVLSMRDLLLPELQRNWNFELR